MSSKSKCPACQKTVYFAERKTAMGKDWHKGCFRCSDDTCKRVMSPGEHSESGGKPYCKRCYQKNFGPKGFHAGGTSESYVYKK